MARIQSLQAGRGLAALSVVLLHSGERADDAAGTGPELLSAVLSWGYLGVDFFFVLSGFIILYSHLHDPRSSAALFSYAKKRLVRIYVPYLPVSIGMIALFAAFPNPELDFSWLTSLTLLPAPDPPILAVAWTLVHEMVFYTIFALFYLTRRFAVLIAIWVLAILAASIAGGAEEFGLQEHSAAVARVILAPLNLEFVAGMLAALLVSTTERRMWPVFLPLGLAGCVAFFLWPDTHRVFFGTALAFVVVGAVDLERRGNIRTPELLVYLGAASYSVYLVHNPVVAVVARALAVIGVVGWWPVLLICALGGTLAGLLYHQFYERPALRIVRQRLWISPAPRNVRSKSEGAMSRREVPRLR